MDKIHYSIDSEQIECTHSYSWKTHKNDTVDVSSSAYHSMSKWANQCKRSFQGSESEADDGSGSEHGLKCGGNIPVPSILGKIAVKKWYSICCDWYWFCEADEQIRYSQVN